MKCVPILLSLSYMLSCLGLNLQFSTKHTTCKVHRYHINVIYNSFQNLLLPRNHWSFPRVANIQSHGSSTGRCSWNWGTGIDCTSACWSGRVQVSNRFCMNLGIVETSSASGPSKSSLSSSILAAGSSTIFRSLTRSVTSLLSNYSTKWKGWSAGKNGAGRYTCWYFARSTVFHVGRLVTRRRSIVLIWFFLMFSDFILLSASMWLCFSAGLLRDLADILWVSWTVVRVVRELCDL